MSICAQAPPQVPFLMQPAGAFLSQHFLDTKPIDSTSSYPVGGGNDATTPRTAASATDEQATTAAFLAAIRRGLEDFQNDDDSDDDEEEDDDDDNEGESVYYTPSSNHTYYIPAPTTQLTNGAPLIRNGDDDLMFQMDM